MLRGGDKLYHPSCRKDLGLRFGYHLTEGSLAQLLSLSPAVQILFKPFAAAAAACAVGSFPTAAGCLCALLSLGWERLLQSCQGARDLKKGMLMPWVFSTFVLLKP